MVTPFVLGIVGDSGSGKSTIADAVTLLLGPERVTDVRLDDYHRYTREERAERGMTALNPLVHNFALMQEHLQLLRSARPIRNRSYNHQDGSFGALRSIEPREIVLVRGLLGYPSDELRGLYHLAVFLQPEPELLFRWKLRRDVQSRGYTEAEVLKYIANHLLDSKQYVLPQADRADLVVRHELPDWEAPDSEVRTTLLLRRAVGEIARGTDLLEGFGAGVRVEDLGEEVRIEFESALSVEQVESWAKASFPDTFDPARIGRYTDDDRSEGHRPALGVVEVIIARLAELMRVADAPA